MRQEIRFAHPTDATNAKMKIQMHRQQTGGTETKFEHSVRFRSMFASTRPWPSWLKNLEALHRRRKLQLSFVTGKFMKTRSLKTGGPPLIPRATPAPAGRWTPLSANVQPKGKPGLLQDGIPAPSDELKVRPEIKRAQMEPGGRAVVQPVEQWRLKSKNLGVQREQNQTHS